MKHPLLSLIGSILLATSLLTFGCGGGGGGGGGVLSPDTGFEGISGTLDFSRLATPTAYSSVGWPLPAGETSFSVPAFTNSNVAGVLLANFTSASQTIVLSANQNAFGASTRNEISAGVRAFERTHLSDFHAGLRSLERKHSRLVQGNGSSQKHSSIRVAAPGTTHDFKVYSDGGYFTVTGNLYSSTQLPDGSGSLLFYADSKITQTDSVKTYFNILIAGWNSIFTTMHASFGEELQSGETPTGIDLGNDIYVLISPTLGEEIDPLLAGFFYSGDLYPPDRLTNGISNELKIFYLNLRLEGSDALTPDIMKSTMAHEFQHMIFYSNRIKNGVTSDDAWLNETLSAYAESACGFKVTNGKNQSKAIQMQSYFNSMNQVPLVQDDGWGSNEQYGQVALFGEWFAEKYASALKSLYASSKTGMAAVEVVTGKPFETIFTEWMLAMYLDMSNSVYGFNSLDWNTEYTFGDLAPITLTGPIKTGKNLVSDASLDASQFTLMPMSCYMIRFSGGGNGESLDFSIQPGSSVTVFELNK